MVPSVAAARVGLVRGGLAEVALLSCCRSRIYSLREVVVVFRRSGVCVRGTLGVRSF